MGMRQVRRCRQAQRERENQRRRESMQKQWKKKHDIMEVIQRDRGDKKRLNPKNIFMNSLLPEDSSRVTVRPTGCEAFSLLYLVTPQSGLQLQSQTKPLQRAHASCSTLTGMKRCLEHSKPEAYSYSSISAQYLWYQVTVQTVHMEEHWQTQGWGKRAIAPLVP